MKKTPLKIDAKAKYKLSGDTHRELANEDGQKIYVPHEMLFGLFQTLHVVDEIICINDEHPFPHLKNQLAIVFNEMIKGDAWKDMDEHKQNELIKANSAIIDVLDEIIKYRVVFPELGDHGFNYGELYEEKLLLLNPPPAKEAA